MTGYQLIITRPDAAPMPWGGSDPAFNTSTNCYVPVVRTSGNSAPAQVPPPPPPAPTTTTTTSVQYVIQQPQPTYTFASMPAYHQVVYLSRPAAAPAPPPPPPSPKEIVKSVGIGTPYSQSVEVIQLNNSSREIIEKFYMYAPSPSHGAKMVAKFINDGYSAQEWVKSDNADPNFAYYIIVTKSFKGVPGCSPDAEPTSVCRWI